MESYELAYFDTVRGFIDARLERMRSTVSELKRNLREEGRQYYLDHPLGASLDHAALHEHLSEAESRLADSDKLRADIAVYERLRDAPYFGRVVFEADDGERENVYVGLRSLADLDGFRFYVYDWRAPVSSLFYTGETGRASYASPGGTVEGTIRGIRQYKFDGGRLTAHWDADLRIDDSVLHGVLSSPAGEKLRTIVNTIQREQNAAIRFDPAESLVVTGPAGCGKTSVGMHRLAWLLYEMRTSLLSPDILMFTANEAFRRYVSGVLPELGEDEINFCSLGELFSRFIGVKTEPQLRQTEAILCADPFRCRNTAAVCGREFLRYVETAVGGLSAHFRTLACRGRTVLSADVLKQKYSGLSPSLTPTQKLEILSQWAAEEIRNWFRIHEDFVRETVEEKLPSYASAKPVVKGFRDKFLSNARQMILAAVLTDPIVLYRRFFTGYHGDGELSEALAERLEKKDILFEDASVILYIGALTGVYRTDGKTLHVLLDEAQDISPVLHRALRKLYPKAVFTVLADVNQAIVPSLNTVDVTEIAATYDAGVMKLNKSFRATRPLGEFAKRYLDGEDYELFDRDGKEPTFRKADDHVKETAGIIRSLADGMRSVCVILPTVRDAAAFYRRLRPTVPDCAAVTDANSGIGSRVVILPVALTKGLEFDAVIIPHFDKTEKDRRLAYMMTTRALHELYLITD